MAYLQTDIDTPRHSDRHTHIHIHILTYNHTGRENTGIQADIQAYIKTGRQAGRQTAIHRDVHTYNHTDRLRQTDRHAKTRKQQ